MGQTLYLECYSGISGDMTVAALLDLGASQAELLRQLDTLGVDGYHIHFHRVEKQGIAALRFEVALEHEADDHDHPSEHTHEHAHIHDHTHDHTHRNLHDILHIIDHSGISSRAKQWAAQMFTTVAEAEAKVHGKPVAEVHFHEVGAVDSIVDIVAAAICLDMLDVGTIICSPLHEGTGTIRCAHGVMPVPAPATAQIALSAGIPLVITDNRGEMVTPTGAAIAALANRFGVPAAMRIQAIGIGAGKKDFPQANVLRAYLIGEDVPAATRDQVVRLSCHIDDSTPEELGYTMEKLFEAGALDCVYTPAYMKKNRPAWELTVLCPVGEEGRMAREMFLHTSTIGLRVETIGRIKMERRLETVDSVYGPAQIKVCRYGDIEKKTVEYNWAKEVADRHKISIRTVYSQVLGANSHKICKKEK